MSTVTIPLPVAQAALELFAADPRYATHAYAIERAISPPNVWVLTVPATRESASDLYPRYLGTQLWLATGEEREWQFGAPAEAQLFSDAERDTFDSLEALAAVHGIDDPETLTELDEAGWELAPQRETVADAFAAGNTEIDYLESMAALASRAEEFRAAL